MSEPKDTPDEKDVPPLPLPPPATPLPHTEKWRKWYIELKVACADIGAVTEDLLRPTRERDLGVREATRIYTDAREKLMSLFAFVEHGSDTEG
jgi:hypothetical protein